ncbi:MAG: hypothetical protein K9J30_07565 [Bacteroidales bacterium]|nr:hypothetical protein [Bacteroidales bacterium]
MNKAGVILEIVWFVMGGLLLFIGVDATVNSEISESWYYFLFALLAFVMYLRRRKIRLSDK